MTIAEAVDRISRKYAWTARWFRLGEVSLGYRKRDGKLAAWTERDTDKDFPGDYITHVGCKGESSTGKLAWILFDLDVGHGNPEQQFSDTEAAIKEAYRIREFLNGQAEIRLSTGGNGVHVVHEMPDDSRPASDGPLLVKAIVAKLDIRCDRTVLGRQVRWLWTRKPNPNSFKLIEAHP